MMRVGSLLRGRRVAAALIAATSLALFAGSAHAVDLLPPVIPTIPPPPPPPACDNSFYASAYYLYMTRRDPAPTPLVSTFGNPGLGDVLDASDFNFGWRDGVEARAGFIICHFGAEAGVFALRSWTAEVFPTDVGDMWLETNPATSAIGVTDVYSYDRTEIFGADLNFVFQPNQHFQFYAGVAYLRLSDTLSIELTAPSAVGAAPTLGYGVYRWDVLNSMIGPQIGVRGKVGSLTPGTFFLGGDVRAGILFNRITNNLLVDRSDPVPGDLTGSDTANSVVTMLGGGVQVGFQATANLSITVGYRALFLHNVALAPDQVAQSPNLNGLGPAVVPIGTAAGGNFLAHGFEVGLHLNF